MHTPDRTKHTPTVEAFNTLYDSLNMTMHTVCTYSGISRSRIENLRNGVRNGEPLLMTYPEQFILEAIKYSKDHTQ